MGNQIKGAAAASAQTGYNRFLLLVAGLGGLLYGVGKLLRSSRFDQGGFMPGGWRGQSVPQGRFRAIYLASHFRNFYEAAPPGGTAGSDQPAGRARRRGEELRAHPSLQPGRHGRAAASVQGCR